jgi:hyaluronate lyase
MLYVYNADLQQFSENYWPTINQFRLPGTTAESGVQYAPHPGASTNFVGGVEAVDGQRGLSVMDLNPTASNLRGKKAWFFLDNEIVCLGAGLATTGGKTVITVVENRRLNSPGNNAFLVNNVAALTGAPQVDPGTPTPLTVSYAHLTGNVANSDIGYYFPGGASLVGLRESRSRRWTDINQTANRLDYNALFTNNYLSLHYDHGVNPTAGAYSYAILPNFTAAQTQSYAASPQYTVLENSPAAQAVKDTVNPAIGAVFWQDAVKTVGTGIEAITSDKRAAVFVAFGSTTDVTISNPTQAAIGTVNLEIARPAAGLVGTPDAGITVTQYSPTIKIAFAATGTKGLTRMVRFSSTAGPTEVIVDNLDTGATFTGAWATSTAGNDRYGPDYVHDYNTGATGGKKVTFTPNLTAAGSYDVYVSWSTNANRANNVTMEVVDTGGSHSIYPVNQRVATPAGGWYLLGTFMFAAGTGGSVIVHNDAANGYVIADAVRFVPH